MDSELAKLLLSLGINIASNAIYDFLRNRLQRGITDKESIKSELAAFLNIQGAEIKAEKIIDFLASNGDIRIEGSSIYANQSINMLSQKNTTLTFGNKSTSTTDKTKIEAGLGAFIHAQGGAGIRQDEDGSISFHV